jgi:hypothetical protein
MKYIDHFHDPEFTTLVDFVEGRLSEEEAFLVEAHLQRGCASCQASIGWLVETLSFMLGDTWEAPPAPVREIVLQAFATNNGAVSWEGGEPLSSSQLPHPLSSLTCASLLPAVNRRVRVISLKTPKQTV